MKTFTYLGSTLAEDEELDAEVTHRVQSGWKNWKRVSGVLCNRRMNVKIKGKVYRKVVRPALMYGAETWALEKAQEKKLEVAEMRMLRWMCGVTKLDKIRNERIRGDNKSVGNRNESSGKEVEVVWPCVHFPPLADLFIPTPFSASLGSILAMQQLRNDYSLTCPPLSIARYSFIQLSRLRRREVKENAQTSKR